MDHVFRGPNGELLHGNGVVVRSAPRQDAQTMFEQQGAEATWEVPTANETANNDYCDICTGVMPIKDGYCSACGNPI